MDQLVSGKGKVQRLEDKDGYIFLDYNGTIFEYILDYLRDGELIYPEDSKLKKRMREDLANMQLIDK